jgi:hypothetical protein
MKQKLTLILLVFIFSFDCKAQFAIGFGVGFSNNYLNTNISNRTFTQNKNGSSAGFGILVNCKINNRIGIESSVELLQKKYSFVRNGIYEGVFESFINSYLQIPVVAQFKVIEKKKINVAINSGVYGGYRAFAKIKGAIPNIYNNINDSIGNNGQSIQHIRLTSYSEKYHFLKEDNRFEFGWILGIALNYQFNRNYSVVFECNYYQAITNQQKNYIIYQTPKYNETLFASIGCLLHIGKK